MFSRTGFAAAIAVLLLSAPLGAQTSAVGSMAPGAAAAGSQAAGRSDSPSVERTSTVGAPRATAAAGVRASEAGRMTGPTAPPPPTSRNMALMIVGGAALIVGAVIGGDSGTIIMIGGGVIGLVGLWNYLK